VTIPSFEEYVAGLGRMSAHVDPTVESSEGVIIQDAAQSIAALPELTAEVLGLWVSNHPDWVPTLGYAVGLSQEKLKNSLRHALGTNSWRKLALTQPDALVEYLESDFELLRSLEEQRNRTYDFGDILVARAGGRAFAIRAGASGRSLEDAIEDAAISLGLTYETRTKFRGRGSRTAPCDLVIPDATQADIVVAAKGFDSTGSKLTDAVREIEEMAEVRLPRQVVIAVIDGIGWKSRQADLLRIHKLWVAQQIDGMYNLSTIGAFKEKLHESARVRGLLD
jgi:hypothetical protein